MTDYLAATQRSYDTIAEAYADWVDGELESKPFDRAMLTAFAELVDGPVADVGCGPGRISSFLHEQGVAVSGFDLSPAMVTVARHRYPELEFRTATMTALPLADGVLGGLVAWYSIIHLPDDDLPAALTEFWRVLTPGGHLQLAFQIGAEIRQLTNAVGHDVELDFHRRLPEQVIDELRRCGFEPRAHLVRQPDDDGPFPERTPQAYLLARKPAA